MRVVGLVGGSGTGKSTVASHLARRGAGVVDADRIAHELVSGDPEVVRSIRNRFGDAVFTDGLVDRKKLGAVVFAKEEARRALEAIVHPRVLARCSERIREFESRGVGLVVIDAALLLEVEAPFELDLVIALQAPREVQIERLVAKGGATAEEIRARLDSQSSLDGSFERADAVIDTARPIDEVLSEVDRVLRERLPSETDGKELPRKRLDPKDGV